MYKLFSNKHLLIVTFIIVCSNFLISNNPTLNSKNATLISNNPTLNSKNPTLICKNPTLICNNATLICNNATTIKQNNILSITNTFNYNSNQKNNCLSNQKDIENNDILNNRFETSVLVATPNAQRFNEIILNIMQGFSENVNYTVTSDLNNLTPESMLEYDVVWTFNVSLWDDNTGLTSSTEWSDKLGDFIDLGGKLLECELVQSNDEYGLDGGNYIINNKSPFTKSNFTISDDGSLGDIAIADHEIMDGVTSLTTDYYHQDVSVRQGSTLVASWSDGTPLVAFNNNVVAVNASPIGFYDGFYLGLSLFGDGYKMLHNCIIYLKESSISVGIPSSVDNLTATPNEDGELSVDLSWTNPTLTAQGDVLTSLTEINVYLDNNLDPIYTISNPIIGEEVNYNVSSLTNGEHVFTVIPKNENGNGIESSINVFVGFDVPSAVTNLTLVSEGNNGVLNWEAPTTGLNGGNLGDSPIFYKIERFPDNVVLENDFLGTTFVDSLIPELGEYSYKVTSCNSQGLGGESYSNTAFVGMAIEPPYNMGFEDNENYQLWDIVDANNDGSTWERKTFGGVNNSCAMSYNFSFNNDADDWLISPKLYLKENKTYVIKVDAKKHSDIYNESFKVFIGEGKNPSELTTELFSTNPDYEFTQLTSEYKTFEMSTYTYNTGSYYIGIKATSPANQFFMYIDNFEIYEYTDVDLQAISLVGPLKTTLGQECTFNVKLKNLGNNSTSNYSINLIDNNNNILATSVQDNCPNIEPQGYANVLINFTPETVGELSVRAQVVCLEDENQNNDISPEFILNVIDNPNIHISNIGYEQYLQQTLPANFLWFNSVSQVIYYQEDIDVSAGLINELIYFYDFEYTLEDKNIKIWFANTQKEELDNWIPLDEFTLVYDGFKTFDKDENIVVFDLSNSPFIYTGENLAIMIEKEDFNYKNNCNFYQTNNKDGKNCSLHFESDNPIVNLSIEGIPENYYPNICLTLETEFGSLTGIVTDSFDNSPIQDATISYDNLFSTTTNNNGEYNFDYISVGEHIITVSKQGYFTETDTVNILANTQNNKSFELSKIPNITITGKVIPSDNLNSGIEGAKVTLTGYQNYETTTNYEGIFTIENVYSDNEYTLVIDAKGYYNYTQTINIDDNTESYLNLGDIVLEVFVCNPVQNLLSFVEDDVVTLEWDNPKSNKLFKVKENNIDIVKINKKRNRDIQKGSAKIVLEAHNVWGDRTGYQFLLDKDHNTYGDIIPIEGPLFFGESVGDDFYINNFEYFIPEDAEPNVNTSTVIMDGVGEVVIPSGIYDWCITNPTPGENMWIASDDGTHPARADDYIFESGYEYTFTISMYGLSDGVDLTLNDFSGYIYNIYRDGEKIESTTNNTFTEKHVTDGEYNYCVEAVYEDICTSEQNCVNVIVDVCKPIENLTTNIDDNNVTLSWEHNIKSNIKTQDNVTNSLSIVKERNRSIPKGNVKIILEAHNVWNDGTGYQFLLDEDHNTFGDIIPETGPLFKGITMGDDFYTNNFEYFIPKDAKPYTNTTTVILDGEDEVIIPAGVYDWCITNPTPGTMWIVSDYGSHPGRANDYTFNEGYEYRFIISKYNENDGAFLETDSFNEFSYNIYRNNEKIDNTSNLSYIDKNVPVGEYEYCIETIYGDVCNSQLICSDEIVITGINDLSKIKIYPNPANDKVKISGIQIKNINIYNTLGQLIETTSKNEIDVSNYKSGVYLFKIITIQDNIVNLKIIVE